MIKEKMFEIVKDLPFDVKKTVQKNADTEIQLLRPGKLPKRFKDYDVTKNFQIWLKEGKREFRPNHLRLLIDLNLRVRSRPDLKKPLLLAFDNIYYGNDPSEELKKLVEENYDHYLNDIEVIGTLAQLFVIEQEYCYSKESNYDPPTLFFQGWVRVFIDSPKEIDNLCMSVARFQPPAARYTSKEDRNHKKFQENVEPLWYIDNLTQSEL